MNTYNWYQTLIKPSWAPPSYLFGPVWTFLYILIAISYGRVFYLFYKRQIPSKIVLPFILNIVFNIIFSPIQFTLQNNILAMVDIFLVFLTLVWAMKVIYKYEKWLTYIQIPYLAWVSFATVLQVTVTYLNF
jgi:tryptophan-rich sensory protein